MRETMSYSECLWFHRLILSVRVQILTVAVLFRTALSYALTWRNYNSWSLSDELPQICGEEENPDPGSVKSRVNNIF